jgi:hypothetical protein
LIEDLKCNGRDSDAINHLNLLYKLNVAERWYMKINWFESKETVYVYLALLRSERGRKLILALSCWNK